FVHWAGMYASLWTFCASVLLVFLCASQLAITLVNWFVTVFVRPTLLPRLDYSQGIPAPHRAMVVVPAMLNNSSDIEGLLETLEVRYLANRDKNVFFALLTDFRDAKSAQMPEDAALFAQARAGIESLNQKYGADRHCIFYLFHRPRLWNES